MVACECEFCEGYHPLMADEDKDSAVTSAPADSEPRTSVSDISVDFDNDDDARGIAALFIALGDVFGAELAVEFLYAVTNCPPDEEVKIVIGTKKLHGSTRPYDPMANAREWLTATEEKPFAERDVNGQVALATRYQEMISEEAGEIYEELGYIADGHGSLPRLAKEISDMEYHINCLAVLMGINHPAVFQLVHDNNMTKIDPETGAYTRRSDGKVLKPIGFQSLTEDEIAAVMG